MSSVIDPLSTNLIAISYFGDVVFAVSGALTAARFRMDVVGLVLVGTITGIGGGTIRDLLLGRIVWWTQNPFELLLCASAALIVFFVAPYFKSNKVRKDTMLWADALGLSVFGVLGCHIALEHGAPVPIAVFMGMLTATGGGVLRDLITNTQPLIMSGQVYATAALLGSFVYAVMRTSGYSEVPSEVLGCSAAFLLRASAVIFDIRMGPPGDFIRIGNEKSVENDPNE